jgi:hypothetical protein
MLAAAAVISLAGATGASAQVFVAEPYVVDSYTAAPVYVAPPSVYVAPPAAIVVAPPAPIGGYAQPRYSYTINGPRYGTIYTNYREPGGCTIGADGFRYCY